MYRPKKKIKRSKNVAKHAKLLHKKKNKNKQNIYCNI